MPNQAHTKRQITTRAQPSRIAPARSHHSNNDHMKGNEHAIEAQKHSKVAARPAMRLTRKAYPRSSTAEAG